MSISIQTNVDSMVAQENLSVNSSFQSKTIQQITSGYRINSSADDAAGLAIANGFRSTETELTQGVQNANDGISTLQIVDGGMNNISQMLDRLRTLATQSASGTFTGDRNVLNNEFQSLLTEIDRQSQSIGLNQGGQFAQALSVYVGGGKDTTTGGVSVSNGTVSVDLTNATVDSQSLGLKGFQVVAGTTDLGPSSASSVANILADTSNTTKVSGFTDLYFSGPGFSDGSKVKVSVNTQGVTDINSLADAINTAIQAAGSGNTQADTALKNAGIVASVHTDANGGEELAFTSSTTAFQVEAGDQLSNALLGNLQSATLGSSLASTVTGGATTAGPLTNPGSVVFQISGGSLTSPVSLTLNSSSTTTAAAISDLANQVANNSALQAAGISVSGSAGNPLVFTDSSGETFNVQVTGDTAGVLGFGSFVGNGGAADYQSIIGTGFTQNAAYGNAKLEFSFGGGASAANGVTVDLSGGDATAATATGSVANADAHGQALTVSIDGAGPTTINIQAGSTTVTQAAADINAAGAGVTASVNSDGDLVITANSKGGHSVTLGGAAATTFGIAGTVNGNSRSAQSIADALNSAFSTSSSLQEAGLQASVNGGQIQIQSNNGTYFRVNAGGSAATANIGFGTAGASGYAGPTASGPSDNLLAANGVSTTGVLSFTPLQYGGDDQAITISANDPTGALQSKTITLHNDSTSRTGETIDQAISYINQQLQQSNNPTLQSIVAVKENSGGNEGIAFISSLNSFNVAVGSSPNGNGVGNAGTTVKSQTLGTASSVSIDTLASAQQALTAVANAVTKLGTAQAAVGKGQNQLNYAIGLAQSQITNYAAAESRIRDADIAADAANLTKAQVLQQASIAAMAQANSEPQAILSLLKG